MLSLHRTKPIDGADAHVENHAIKGKNIGLKGFLLKNTEDKGNSSVVYSIVPDMSLG